MMTTTLKPPQSIAAFGLALVATLAIGVLASCQKEGAAEPSSGGTAQTSGAGSQPAGAAAEEPSDKDAPLPGEVVVGTGQGGFADDPAQLNGPIRFAPYPDGSLIVADIGNHAIRRIHVDGAKTRVETLVGHPGRAGYRDGPADKAQLASPHGVAVLADGSVAVAEAGNHTIRRLVPTERDGVTTWTVETLAGIPGAGGFADGPGAKAQFRSPHGMVKLPDESLLIADIGNSRLRLLKSGVVTTVAGSDKKGTADGPLGTGELVMPMALVVETKGEEISVLVIDAGAPNLRRFHKTEGLSTVKLPEGLQVPHGIALDEGGALLIAELEGHRVVRLRGDQMDVVFGNGRPSRAPALLNRAADVVVAGGYLWVADIGNHQVKGIPWPPAPAR